MAELKKAHPFRMEDMEILLDLSSIVGGIPTPTIVLVGSRMRRSTVWESISQGYTLRIGRLF